MTGKKADKGEAMAGVREMDELFRRTDFAADEPALEERLWSKIQAKLADRELAEDELEELAAAGGVQFRYGLDSSGTKRGGII